MKTLAVARMTLRRMIRSHYLIGPALLMVAVPVLFLKQAPEGTVDPMLLLQSASMSLFVITNLFCYLGVIWLAVSIVPDEIHSGQLRMNLTKPIAPLSILLGHFLGMFGYLVAGALALALVLTATMVFAGGQPGMLIVGYVLHLLPLYGCLLALGMVTTMLFNRPLSVFLLLFLAYEDFLYAWAQRVSVSDSSMLFKLPLQIVSNVGYALAPPINRLKIRITDFADMDFPVAKYGLILLYCASYLIIAHGVAAWLLRKKDV